MNNLNIRISSWGLGRELASLNFPCGLILLYSSPPAEKPAYLLITLLKGCKKCFVSSDVFTQYLLTASQTLSQLSYSPICLICKAKLIIFCYFVNLENQSINTYLQIGKLNSINHTPRRITRIRWWNSNIGNRLKKIILNVRLAVLEAIKKTVKNCLKI